LLFGCVGLLLVGSLGLGLVVIWGTKY
jgi:hypothetical protein